ncbi:MAG: T9SS type A sorting domain-containing protein [Altibacter sp.]|uniref:T9SS type A sorting domain-containing protein n=1 Tax=Altibacter sp. TaxID=2024823 RepID=UPI001DFCB668|nr:T9SS type A sorting domain-containing protein [Altibacter sp.]MBZ0328318.1 T9SS type A sorting domain-containing protein [Altibacter sp.]
MKTLFTLPLFLSFTIFMGISEIMAQPVNDLIENAIDLDEGPYPYSELNIAFQNATVTNDATTGGNCEIHLAGIWYKFTATSTGTVAAVMVNPSTPYVVFFTGPNEDVTDGSELTYVDVPSNLCAIGNSATIDTTMGTTYYIYMKNSISSDVLININPALVPENDDITLATDLNLINDSNYLDQDIQFQFATNTNDGGQSGCDTQALEGVWYKFYSNAGGTVIAQMGFDPGDSVITMYYTQNGDATSGSELTYIASNSNICGFSNLTEIETEPNTYYYIFAHSQHAVNSVLFNIDSDILGTSENLLEGFSFYPNPTSLEINLSAKNTIDEVSMYNLLGQRVLLQKPNATRNTVDVSFLQSGLYVMHVSSEGKTATYKIVKR